MIQKQLKTIIPVFEMTINTCAIYMNLIGQNVSTTVLILEFVFLK